MGLKRYEVKIMELSDFICLVGFKYDKDWVEVMKDLRKSLLEKD